MDLLSIRRETCYSIIPVDHNHAKIECTVNTNEYRQMQMNASRKELGQSFMDPDLGRHQFWLVIQIHWKNIEKDLKIP